MLTLKIILGSFLFFIVFQLLKARHEYALKREKILFLIYKTQTELEKKPNDPFFICRRGSLYMQLLNFPEAINDFNMAMALINQGYFVPDKEDVLKKLQININYCRKPLPWSKKGPLNYAGNGIYYFLIDRLGDIRYNF